MTNCMHKGSTNWANYQFRIIFDNFEYLMQSDESGPNNSKWFWLPVSNLSFQGALPTKYYQFSFSCGLISKTLDVGLLAHDFHMFS